MVGKKLSMEETSNIIIENLPNILEYEENSKYVTRNWNEIMKLYGGKYIGVFDQGDTIISRNSGKKVIKELKKMGKEKEAYYGYVPKRDEICVFMGS